MNELVLQVQMEIGCLNLLGHDRWGCKPRCYGARQAFLDHWSIASNLRNGQQTGTKLRQTGAKSHQGIQSRRKCSILLSILIYLTISSQPKKAAPSQQISFQVFFSQELISWKRELFRISGFPFVEGKHAKRSGTAVPNFLCDSEFINEVDGCFEGLHLNMSQEVHSYPWQILGAIQTQQYNHSSSLEKS